jgi:hypothetical protein
MNTSTPATATPADTRTGMLHRLLWLSAALLSLVLVIQFGVPEAMAFGARGSAGGRSADVSSSGDYTMLTLRISNEDILLVLDGRNESLTAYRIRNKTMFELIAPEDLTGLFARGKRIGAGVK